MIYLCSVLRVYLKVGLNDLYLGAWIKNYNKKILQSAVVLDLSNKVICNLQLCSQEKTEPDHYK